MAARLNNPADETALATKTVSAFLNAPRQRPESSMTWTHTVVVIDRLGVIPVRQMDKLLGQVQPLRQKDRPHFGDTAQTQNAVGSPVVGFAL